MQTRLLSLGLVTLARNDPRFRLTETQPRASKEELSPCPYFLIVKNRGDLLAPDGKDKNHTQVCERQPRAPGQEKLEPHRACKQR